MVHFDMVSCHYLIGVFAVKGSFPCTDPDCESLELMAVHVSVDSMPFRRECAVIEWCRLYAILQMLQTAAARCDPPCILQFVS